MDSVKTRTQNLLPRSTPSDASKLWPELSGSTFLLLAAVSITVAAGCAVCTFASSSGADGGGARGADGFLVGRGDDLGGEVEPENFRDNN